MQCSAVQLKYNTVPHSIVLCSTNTNEQITDSASQQSSARHFLWPLAGPTVQLYPAPCLDRAGLKSPGRPKSFRKGATTDLPSHDSDRVSFISHVLHNKNGLGSKKPTSKFDSRFQRTSLEPSVYMSKTSLNTTAAHSDFRWCRAACFKPFWATRFCIEGAPWVPKMSCRWLLGTSHSTTKAPHTPPWLSNAQPRHPERHPRVS